MMYRIVWKKNKQIYTEYKDMNGVRSILSFIEENIDNGFELVSVTTDED